MATKIVYEVVLEEMWRSNLRPRRGKFPVEGKYSVISDRGPEFAVLKAKSHALKRREAGTQGAEEKEYDDSCIEASLKSVNPLVTVDC